MDGYYDYHPRHVLDRPLALAGMVTRDVRALGYRLAALTGMPFVDLDRKIEHHAGKSVWELVATEGEARYRALESALLPRALRERPAGILVLGDGTLLASDNRARIETDAQLVHLATTLANTYWRLQPQDAVVAEHWHPLHPGPLTSVEQVRPFYDRRRALLDAAPHTVILDDASQRQVLDRLQELMAELAST